MTTQTYFCGIKLTLPSDEERKALEQLVLDARKEAKKKSDSTGIPDSVFILRAKSEKASR